MKKIIPAFLALMLVFVLVGCGPDASVGGGSSVGAGNSNNTQSTLEPAITAAEAKAFALSHAALSETDIREFEIELDRDGGPLHYDIEFKHGGYEYDYEIDASNGSVLNSSKDLDT